MTFAKTYQARVFVQLKHAVVEDHYVYNERKDEDGPLSSRRPRFGEAVHGELVRKKMTSDAVLIKFCK